MKRFKETRNLILSSLVLMCLGSISARADLITIAISGQVNHIDDQFGKLQNQVHLWDTISGTYTYDSATPNTGTESGIGLYFHSSPSAGISLYVGGLNFKTDPTNVDFLVSPGNNYSLAGEDSYVLLSYHNSPLSNGALVDFIEWQLDDPTGTALSSDALPLTAPDLSKWPNNGLTIYGGTLGINGYLVGAQITSATVVPEPATLLLLGLGGLMLRKRIQK